MSETSDELRLELEALTRPAVRGRLVARGLARGMIWREGQLPPEAPPFAPALTEDLLDHGYLILAKALRLRDLGQHSETVERALLVAAEAIESAVRRGTHNESRGFHLVAAAAAFHIGHYAARAACLLGGELSELNLSTCERLVCLLIRRRMSDLRRSILSWLNEPAHSDGRLAEAGTAPGIDDLAHLAITRSFSRALATFDLALELGDATLNEAARERLRQIANVTMRLNSVTYWWACSLARHLIDDLWNHSLHQRLPIDGGPQAWLDMRARYLAVLAARDVAEVDLWPSQLEAAARAVDAADDLTVALPTSAGKTRVAELCILRALADGKRVVYVTPLRALSAQVERVLGRTFRPLGFKVSSLYGASGVASVDIATLQDGDIVVATPEKLDFALRQQPSILENVAVVVLDEGHMIGLGAREVRYEVLVQRLLRREDADVRRIVCLSAIFASGESFSDFTSWIRSDAPGGPVMSNWRPTRQRFGVIRWRSDGAFLQLRVENEKPWVQKFVVPQAPIPPRRTPFPRDEEEMLIASAVRLIGDGHRVLVYCPLRDSVEKSARTYIDLQRRGFVPSLLSDCSAIGRALAIGEEWLGRDHTAMKALRLGVAVHHGGLPRPFLAEIEGLLDAKVLSLAVASPTLAQGVDLSCSVLFMKSVFRGVVKESGGRVWAKPIPAEEFANVIGRAGRAFVDLDGLILCVDMNGAKEATFWTLVQSHADRQLESGIFQLIGELVDRLIRRIGAGDAAFHEYILNQAGAWFEEPSRVPDPDAVAKLEMLDAAIIGSVSDPATPPEELARALDDALRNSLWARRVSRCEAADARRQHALLHARARWLWARTNGYQRQGFYSAGIGFATGSPLDENIEVLQAEVLSADRSLVAGDAYSAGRALANAAQILFKLPSFRPNDDLPNEWVEVLIAWLAGVPVGEICSQHGNIVDFLQDGIVYRLVWAVEAVRVHAEAKGLPGIEEHTGLLPLALTFGMPTRTSAFLAQSGFPMRGLALRLLARVPREFSDSNHLEGWTAEVERRVHDLPAPEQAVWDRFVASRRSPLARRWELAVRLVQVHWTVKSRPAPGAQVRIVHDSEGNAAVYAADLTPLGVPAEHISLQASGNIRARVEADGNHIRVSAFGPP